MGEGFPIVSSLKQLKTSSMNAKITLGTALALSRAWLCDALPHKNNMAWWHSHTQNPSSKVSEGSFQVICLYLVLPGFCSIMRQQVRQAAQDPGSLLKSRPEIEQNRETKVEPPEDDLAFQRPQKINGSRWPLQTLWPLCICVMGVPKPSPVPKPSRFPKPSRVPKPSNFRFFELE